jgi:DNA-directed RNA polymerase II subunit RPB7
MGFFVVTLKRDVEIHPKFFGAKLMDRLTQRLSVEVEGSFAGKHGFVVAVLEILQEPVPEGRLDDVSGMAVFTLAYQAVVFRPFKGEVLNAVVTKVVQHGFFAEAGPLTIFVSYHLLPDEMKFNPLRESWRSESIEDSEEIRKESAVRLRILGLKIEATTISATGSVKEDWLGLIDT